MDFFTAQDAPVRITIDGTAYDLPRFLLPAMKQWSAAIRKQIADEATAHLDADAKARFLTFFQPPAIDLMQLAERAVSADADYPCRAQMKLAGVPEDVIENLMTKSDPLMIRKLADELTTAARAKAKLEQGKEGENPLSEQAGASAA